LNTCSHPHSHPPLEETPETVEEPEHETREPVADYSFSHSPLVQIIVDPVNDRIVGANLEACAFFAASELQLRQQPLSQVFAIAMPELLVFTQEVLEKNRAWADSLMLERVHGDGRKQQLRVEMAGKKYSDGDLELMHLCIQDSAEIDNRRSQADANRHYQSGIGHWNRVARVFQEFEHENQLILEAAGEGIYGVDTEGMTTFVNPAAERMFGYSVSELAGRNIHSMIHHSHSDGSRYPVENCPIYEAFRDGVVHSVEDDVFWTKSGKPIEVEYTSTPIKDQGYIVGAVVIFRDVSQKKADKRQLLAALAEVEQLKNRLEMENAYLQEEINSEFNHHQIVGNSSAVQKVIQQISLVAPTSATVLIHGESGTGKELIARAIHEMSQRSKRSLIRVNCAAIPVDLFESEFFGHIKGAFTGATADRHGRFELADSGTLFLDEVGEIPLQLQGKLLRVLQEQQFERVGDSRTHKVDVRIIASTNRNLEKMVASGGFREDLFFRLNVFPIESVPLRKRIEDIPLLTRHFLSRFSTQANKSGLKISRGEMEKLKQYHWPGNIRELENVIERHVILARGGSLRFENLNLERGINGPMVDTALMVEQDARRVLTDQDLRQQERRSLVLALKQCQGKVFGPGGAADLLGVRPTTLASRIKKYRIDVRDFKVGNGSVTG